MNLRTRILLGASAAFMAALGLTASFLPQEILAYASLQPVGFMVVLIQVTGALYLAFAMLNWMSRGNIIGGIYARPLALGNFLHFTVVSITLIKYLMAGQSTQLLPIALPYAVFAVWFGLVMFTHPVSKERAV